MAANQTVTHAAAIGDQMSRELKAVGAQDGVVEVRQIGTMIGIEVSPVVERTGFAVCQAARERGVWVRPLGDVVILMPPLAISSEEATTLTSAVGEAIGEVLR
jgi:adenosylmethionine-8-amino-7-oxononanoate aminotransferase